MWRCESGEWRRKERGEEGRTKGKRREEKGRRGMLVVIEVEDRGDDGRATPRDRDIEAKLA